jgi:16S rRNA (guanine1207-N2)-methyltransferase
VSFPAALPAGAAEQASPAPVDVPRPVTSGAQGIQMHPSARPDLYRAWRTFTATVGGRSMPFVSKPGVPLHGQPDPAAQLLADEVARSASVDAAAGGARARLLFGVGNGLVAATAALTTPGGGLRAADRHAVSVEATRRTLAANGASPEIVRIGQGASAVPTDAAASEVLVRLPPDRLSTLQLLHDAFAQLAVGGRCLVAGATTEGIKPAARALERAFGNAQALAVRSGHRLVSAVKHGVTPADPDVFAEPLLDPSRFHDVALTVRGRAVTVGSRPGVFSWQHLDEATAILAEQLTCPDGASVLDLGCGTGILGIVARVVAGAGPVTMVDVDSEAVRSAARNAALAGITDARVLASDVGDAVRGERFDVVVTNPPFHTGKGTDLAVPLQFIRESWELLRPGGQLLLVANRTLPYEAAVSDWFGERRTLHDGRRFKVLAATRQG